ncbi:DUF1552 domain-containing protein [Stratiformator vulcanicus]|uniref:DUF1552 domain-containing protein n=1 Tax=Stratiformator vulcanicus TaxID=2527980 RepID=A0A517R5B5_9PLAN|nr:DUF1552 domain-containing protein [Stratiformator vulcanicus]QDT39039.1 hypothetical protein Pan189_34400 [Stratiformator vulcanicus]
MLIKNSISRRTMLRGVGATLCLPALESMASAAPGAKPSQRLIFLSYPFGVPKDEWFPTEAGPDYELPQCLKPLERHRKNFSVLSNLSNKNATQAHWGCTTWLTSASVVSSNGSSVKNTVSVDQVAARKLGENTRFQSLELAGKDNNGCGPGLSLSWAYTGNTVAGETSPLALYNRLFGAEEVSLEERKYLLSQDRSVLDVLMSDAKSMHRSISKTDREKVEEYFQSVRDIETRLNKSEAWLEEPKPKTDLAPPENKLSGTAEIKMMYDLIVAAIKADLTRVITYRQPLEGLIAELGYKVTGHETTHCGKNSKPYEASIARTTTQIELLAYLIDQLKGIQEVDGSSVFDHTTITYGGGIVHGHYLRNTPTLVAGHGGGGLNQGEHYVYESEQTPLSNLWLGILRNAGIEADRFADSDKVLPRLFRG